MPEVSIYAEHSAGAVIRTVVTIPDVTPANKIKALAGHEKTASLFAWLGAHEYEKKCPCYVCLKTPNDPDAYHPFKRPAWGQSDPLKPFVRFEIGARNVRLKLRGGEFFVVVAECDVDEWLAGLPANAADRLGNVRLGMALALPLTLERALTKSRREVSGDRESVS